MNTGSITILKAYKPLCTCTLEVESTTHFFLHCHCYNNIRKTLDDFNVTEANISKLSETSFTDLSWEASFDKIYNKVILTASIKIKVDFWLLTWQLLVIFNGNI